MRRPAFRVARPIRDGAHSSPKLRARFTSLVAPCVMSNYSQVIDLCKRRNATSTAIVTCSAAWWRCYEATMNSDKKRTALGAEEATKRDPTALAHAVDLIFATCCLAGAPSVIADFSDEDKLVAIGEHDTAALFN